ncbi:MAG: Hsp20/alpha crystallin family protein [Candidatus Paceibacter sp.]|nr:Hsp20/alpha crystallin family protein [Candidatus Paceibacter sp.]
MAIIPWKPFDMDRFFDDEFFAPLVGGGRPSMDVYETEKDVVAEVSLPGIDPSKVEISVRNDVLEISGHTEEKKEEKGKDYWRKEIRTGSFDRVVRLPVAVKEDKVEASYEKGVLKIVMPKAEEKAEKKVRIKIRESKK